MHSDPVLTHIARERLHGIGESEQLAGAQHLDGEQLQHAGKPVSHASVRQVGRGCVVAPELARRVHARRHHCHRGTYGACERAEDVLVKGPLERHRKSEDGFEDKYSIGQRRRRGLHRYSEQRGGGVRRCRQGRRRNALPRSREHGLRREWRPHMGCGGAHLRGGGGKQRGCRGRGIPSVNLYGAQQHLQACGAECGACRRASGVVQRDKVECGTSAERMGGSTCESFSRIHA